MRSCLPETSRYKGVPCDQYTHTHTLVRHVVDSAGKRKGKKNATEKPVRHTRPASTNPTSGPGYNVGIPTPPTGNSPFNDIGGSAFPPQCQALGAGLHIAYVSKVTIIFFLNGQTRVHFLGSPCSSMVVRNRRRRAQNHWRNPEHARHSSA